MPDVTGVVPGTGPMPNIVGISAAAGVERALEALDVTGGVPATGPIPNIVGIPSAGSSAAPVATRTCRPPEFCPAAAFDGLACTLIALVNCCAKEFVFLLELAGLADRLASASAAAILLLADTMVSLPPALRGATRWPSVPALYFASTNWSVTGNIRLNGSATNRKVILPLGCPGIARPALVGGIEFQGQHRFSMSRNGGPVQRPLQAPHDGTIHTDRNLSIRPIGKHHLGGARVDPTLIVTVALSTPIGCCCKTVTPAARTAAGLVSFGLTTAALSSAVAGGGVLPHIGVRQ